MIGSNKKAIISYGHLSVEGRGVNGIGMCNLEVVFRNGIYVGHLQWDSMKKSMKAWANLYEAWVLEMGDSIFAKGW